MSYKNAQDRIAHDKVYYRENYKKVRASQKTYRLKNKDALHIKAREYNLRRYHLTIAQYEAILVAQNGVCALCKRAPKKVRLNVDHDHLTKEVRGLLCFRCNKQIIGRHNDTVLLYAAINYLNNPPARAVLMQKESA